MKMTLATILFGGLLVFFAVVLALVFIPVFVWHPPQTYVGHPYTPLEERGRVIFYSNGCNYCHTQYVREFDTASGDPSMGGNYAFDNPLILGSERTGPDLSYIGRKRSEAWEREHWKDPRKLSPMSIMPSFEFLSEDDLTALAAYVFNLGDRNAAQYMILPSFNYAGVNNPVGFPMVSPAPDGQPQGWPTWTAAGMQEGKELFVERCLTCHGCAGNGLGAYGGTLTVTPADWKAEPFKSMPADQWFWHVSEGVQGTVMPPWRASMTEDQRWKVIEFARRIYANPVESDPDEGDPTGAYSNLTNPLPQTVETLEEGKHIYTRECWVCHGDAGAGEGIYRQGLLPVPADFSDLEAYKDYTDSDYFWRISEGVPWTAMPAWKVHYDETDRWKLVYYLRVNFTQTLPRPPTTQNQVYQDVALTLKMPEVGSSVPDVQTGALQQVNAAPASFEQGKMMYTVMCARCHGLTGAGQGWAGDYLDVKPANFHGEAVRGLSDGDWFARVSDGIQNSAMPTWGEWMPARNRWDVIKFISEGFTGGEPSSSTSAKPVQLPSVHDNQIPANFIQASTDLWLEEGHTIDIQHGMSLYGTYCATCHNNAGQGMGPGVDAQIAGPSAYPQGMSTPYVFWRAWSGVADTVMPPFSAILSEAAIWDLTVYVQNITGTPLNVAPQPTPTAMPGLATPAPTPTPEAGGG